MFGAMWSEHCAYKHSRPLLASLPTEGERVLVGPGENAGVLDIGHGLAAVFKVESHNHPSAVEPYQGAATGVGGIIRDIFTMGARPIALLNGLRFGPLEASEDASGGTDAATAARNRYLFDGVVSGIAGYGNCVGIPDVGGELFFDASYSGNPLVNAMCLGIAHQDEITLARAEGAGNALLLVGAATGRDGIAGAAFASAVLGEDRDARRPAVQVGNPFMEKLLMEACLELSHSDAVVAMQDLGAAGLTCALAELSARGGCGAEVDLDRVPRRERFMNPLELLLSESQERMLLVVKAGREAEVESVFARFELPAVAIGRVVDEAVVRCQFEGQLACELPGRALVDEAPRYVLPAAPPDGLPDRLAVDLAPLAAEAPSVQGLLELASAPNCRSRKPVWRRYDHMNGTNTLVGPGEGDGALLRINVACSGAVPIGATNSLNLGSPEPQAGYWALSETVAGLGEACRALGIPIVSGNVSLYNETADGPIVPAPLVGMLGLLEDRATAVPMRWLEGDEIWMLGSPGWEPASLAGAEHAWRRGELGGRPRLDLESAARVVRLLPELATERIVAGSHDLSVGGLGVALARMAIASGCGAIIDLPAPADQWPTAALYGEGAGRAIVSVGADNAARLVAACLAADVPTQRLGEAHGERLSIGIGPLPRLEVRLAQLADAWETGF